MFSPGKILRATKSQIRFSVSPITKEARFAVINHFFSKQLLGMSTFSNEFEETISGLVKDSKSELKNISVEMSSEEIKQKKEELIQGLEAKQKLLLEQHQELMEKIRKMQQDAAIIYREGVGIEEQLQQLKSGPFAIAKEPRKKVNFQHISKKTLVIPLWLQSSSFFAIGLVLQMSFKIYLSISHLILKPYS